MARRSSVADRRAADVQAVTSLSFELADRLRAGHVAAAESLGLTFVQAKVLRVLRRDRPVAMRVLARLTHQDPSNLTSVVDRLEARGLIARQAHERDRRVTELVLTEAGEALAEAYERKAETELGPLAGLDGARLQQLRQILGEVIDPPSTG